MINPLEWPLDAPQDVSERERLIAARDKIDAGWETIPQAMREPLADAMEISTAIATRALAEAEKLRRRRDDLLEANNRYLQRARDAEALVAKGVTAVEEMIAEADRQPLTPAALADAFECFWNAALNNAHNEQDRTALATVGSVAEGFAAIANRLREKGAS